MHAFVQASVDFGPTAYGQIAAVVGMSEADVRAYADVFWKRGPWGCAAGVRRGYRFQLCSMGLLTGACSEQEMSSLFQLHRSRTFSLTEVTADEQWKAAQQRLLERVSDCNRADD